ncbi:MAG: hypothetical protein ABIQ40_18805 [Bacteroidia bacterium]
MSVHDLKKAFVSKITETNDEELLKVVYRLLDNIQEVRQFTPEQTFCCKRSASKIKKRKFITDEELHKELSKWLKINMVCKD